MFTKFYRWLLRASSGNYASPSLVSTIEIAKLQIRVLIFISLFGLIISGCSDDENGPVINDVTISSIAPTSPATLLIGEKVTISFSYNTNVSGGVRIFIRPMTGSELSENYSASPSGLYTGSGSSSSDFTITLGNDVHVDRLRIQVWNDDQTELLDEHFSTVDYHFVSTVVEITEITPSTPKTLLMGEKINVKFEYKTIVTGGIRIFARPITEGALSPNYSAHPSPDYISPSGNSMGDFTINQDTPVQVDQVRIQAFDSDSNELLYETFADVDYRYLSAAASITAFGNTTSGEFCTGEDVTFSFNYKAAISGGVYIFIRPFTEGNVTPLYAAHASPLHTASSGTGTGYFTIVASDTTHVDHARIQVWNSTQSTLLYEELIPVDYTFLGSRAKITQLEPASPTTIALDTNVNITFDYVICESVGARIFVRPFTGNTLTPSYAASGSPIYTNSGSAAASFSITAGTNVKVDKLRIQVYNPDQSELLYEFFENVSYTFN